MLQEPKSACSPAMTPPLTKQLKPPKKHVCSYPSCGRAFSTSGHLARHHRIHTGEKNFCCLLPQCHSRFSRQDNMMQHFRTHFLAKSKPSKIHIYPEYRTLPPS
ncbi:hypothetical protein DSO57_1006861 [Entomophthora muscae]|uniref:Uncharacterized protein n=1 Tax=Entomophthora muscae TaxID=34485 RepID=A0ACC2SK69_9FUNG|nr:hypothetical protein DSO57_1006861 [Entomophthora muscae]